MKRLMQIDDLSEFERMALIQSFEICFELSWKLMKDYLESEGFAPKSPRESVKMAFQAGIVFEAQKWMERGRRYTLGLCIWRTVDRFYRSYVCKGGFKDGVLGIIIATYAALYQVMSYFKYWELENSQKDT